MKRSVRILLGVWAAAILLAGIVVGGAHWRAARNLERHRKQVQADLAGVRAALATRPVFDWEPYRTGQKAILERREYHLVESSNLDWAGLASIQKAQLDGSIFPYEACRSVQSDGSEVFSLPGSTWPIVGDPLLVSTVLAQEFLVGAPLELAFSRQAWERNLLFSWSLLLQSERLSAGTLESIASILDRLEAVRPSLRETFQAEYALRRLAVLRVYDKQDPAIFIIGSEPTARHLYSWRILFNRILADLKEDYSLAGAWLDRPLAEQASLQAEANPQEVAFSRFPLRSHLLMMLQRESRLAEERALRRAAVAMAWYREENRKLPGSWEAVVPRYLPAPPVSPACGSPLTLRGQTVRCSCTLRSKAWVVKDIGD